MQPSRAKLPSDTREAIRECYHRNYVELIRTGKNREGRAASPSRSDRRFGHIPIDLRPIYRVAFHAAPVAVLNVPAVTAEDHGQFAAHRIDADGSVSIVAMATREGRKRVREEYNWEKESQKLLHLYRELLPA